MQFHGGNLMVSWKVYKNDIKLSTNCIYLFVCLAKMCELKWWKWNLTVEVIHSCVKSFIDSLKRRKNKVICLAHLLVASTSSTYGETYVEKLTWFIIWCDVIYKELRTAGGDVVLGGGLSTIINGEWLYYLLELGKWVCTRQ